MLPENDIAFEEVEQRKGNALQRAPAIGTHELD
jgi:hypothetical protein